MFDPSYLCFIDKKHLVNSDSIPKNDDAVPSSLDGWIHAVTNGNLRETYNLIACISGNPLKERHLSTLKANIMIRLQHSSQFVR
jgi:hypothetical protein